MNNRKVQAIRKLEETMNKDKKLKGLKIFASIWEYSPRNVSTSIIIENIKDFEMLNYIQTKYKLQTSSQPSSGQMTFNRILN